MNYAAAWSLLALMLMAACTMRTVPDQVAATDARPAAAVFAEMEDRMLNAPAISGRFTVSADGAFSAALQGTLGLSGGETDLEATGTFGADSVTLHLRSDGRVMEGGSAARRFHEDSPAGLTEALLLGLTRMGILHNLARLTGGAVPDRAGGGVRDWVEVRDVHWSGSDPTALRLMIYVSGERAAEATLWLDPDSGWPVRREQVVEFPGGQMRVTESYEFHE
jgi:hypothetical protein